MPPLSLNISGYFGAAGGGKDGALVDIWATTRFSGMPEQDQAPPIGMPDAGPVTTGVNFGGPGAYYIGGISILQDYYIRVQYGGHAYWSQRTAAALGGAPVGGGGGGGGGTVIEVPYTFGPAYATGLQISVPVDATWIRDAWLGEMVANNGLTPKGDIGFYSSGNAGMLLSRGAAPWPMNVIDSAVTGNTELLYNPQSVSISSSIQNLQLVSGPPAQRSQVQFSNAGAAGLLLTISQDGSTSAGVGALLTAQTAIGPTLNLTITHNTNDNFNFNGVDPVGGGGAAATLKFAILPGGGTVVYTSMATLAAAVGAATNTVAPFEPFSTYVTVGVDGTGGKLTMTSNPPSAHAGNFPGAAGNGCIVFAGNHDALNSLGFTGANVFKGGVGGDSGATAGSGIIYLDIVTPIPA